MSQSPNLTGYTLTYDDEFSSSSSFLWSPDGSVGYQTTPYSGARTLAANGEQSMYSDSTIGVDPFSISNGALHITAAPGTNPYNLPYNTGMISTEGNFNQEWGYFEIRAEVAQGPGMWSAFYLLPTDKAWPPEVDAMEAFGANNPQYGGGPNQYYHGTIAPARDTQSAGGWATEPGANLNIWTGYHTYGVDVEPDKITWYFDGQPVSNVAQVTTPDGYTVPFYMVVALAVGGWSGNPTGETGIYNIDYIRAYSKDPNATPTSFQAISSPDGADSSVAGVVTAHDVALTPTTIDIRASQDKVPWVDAAFIVTVDGVQVGPMETTSAIHANGQWQDIVINANLRNVPHTVGITFVNDDYVSDTQDRNLYINSVSLNGTAIANSSADIRSNETVSFSQAGGGTGGTGSTDLTVRVSEDAYSGDAQFIVTVDGVQMGGVHAATASHAAHQWQDVAIAGGIAIGTHTVGIQFINDAWGGSPALDRNLYVQSITINGDTVPYTAAHNNASNGQTAVDSVELAINGTATFTDTPTSGTGGTGGTGGSSTGLTVHVSEDAWNGDAQFTVTVDGQQVGGVRTVTASHTAGQWQDISIASSLAAGPHAIGINFINDGWGGSAATDRNMYVQSITANGETIPGTMAQDTAANGEQSLDPNAAVMAINGTATFHSTGSSGTPQPSTLVLHVAEDAWNGNAQFTVSVDGQQVGGVQTATAIHGQGQVQDITLSGNFGNFGPDKIDLTFLNDAWGGSAATDRNLYIESIDINGVHFAGNTAVNDAANGQQALDPNAAVMAIDGIAEFHINHTAPPEVLG